MTAVRRPRRAAATATFVALPPSDFANVRTSASGTPICSGYRSTPTRPIVMTSGLPLPPRGPDATSCCVKEIRSLESRRVKIAILGVGRLGAFHAKALRALPGVDELRINDADSSRAAALAKELGAEHAASIDAALDGADAVVIVTPTGTHAELIRRALDKSLAVFCEKPIALDLESTKRVVEQVDKTKGRVQIGFQRRFDAGFQEARRRVRAGELGTVYSFHMTSRDALPPPDAYIETSGGQCVDQLIHDFDVTRWMFDEVDEVYATGSTLGFPQYAKWGDVATSGAVLTLRGGVVGLLQAARHNEAGYAERHRPRARQRERVQRRRARERRDPRVRPRRVAPARLRRLGRPRDQEARRSRDDRGDRGHAPSRRSLRRHHVLRARAALR